ncbi:Lipoxygenase [Heracleum sosnowskyi]|uniref:Lipoxygenase n=1 Tax=Heracleum sosnowskyi TaxID=360622 RepID=A0AAD8I0V5_9APIA|nr:Lipoxygenase [Heracleum sosnowskyi]
MALANEIMGFSVLKNSSFVTSSNILLLNSHFSCQRSGNRVCFSPVVCSDKNRFQRTTPLAAITESLVKIAPELAVKFTVRAVITVRNNSKQDFKDSLVKRWDSLTNLIRRNVVLQLVSTQVDPRTGTPKKSRETVLKDWSEKSNVKEEIVNYTADFVVDSSFGVPGAITVVNKNHKEFFVVSITIEGFACGPVHFPCNSWVQSNKDLPGKRIFFSNQPYLPSETPAGLRALRQKELRDLRGDGKGVRKLSDRIYDYDVYNDLGIPDRGIDFVRPTLGGEKISYPRRCRTGCLPSISDEHAESRVEKPLPMYVPRDERFEECKANTFSFSRFKGMLHNLLPAITAKFSPKNPNFKGFEQIDSLYSDGLFLKLGPQDKILEKFPMLKGSSHAYLLKYDIPKIISQDKFAWLRDDEFARQSIAGVNPVAIERLRVFPPVSKLDPEIHGPQESALKEEHIAGQLNGMTVQEALEGNKLFIVDYHDIYLPFIDKINALDGRATYATRTIFFSTPSGTLKPIAIELSLPGPCSRSKRVVTPPVDATTNWLWQLAKAHVCSNDAGVHQLVYHWLRTHACTEPFIIAAHRQLSAMHPIYKLLDPHMRYTLEINALARQNLINADGVVESCFTPGRYAMELSSSAYKNWRFDLEGLPADLIQRGMAVPDPTQPHGLKLLLADYPYAADGLLIWDAINDWVRTYVNHYYPDPDTVCNDRELQAWYAESINVGHADKRTESWWPRLATSEDLTSILTTLIWLASAQHAALNFGQYPYGGYVPNRPPLMRRLVPDENDPEYVKFVSDPEKYFLASIPSMLQATKYMAVVDTLSTHSADEEYIGERSNPSIWSGDAEIIEAFYKFSSKIGQIEKEIEERNRDPKLKNRCGAGVLPYELLTPSSGPGATGRGIPNSTTI